MKFKRVTLLCGHYGSGKTNIAVNMALELKKQYSKVVLADLDIVNPYFRSVDSEDLLEANGIKVICSPYANTNLDVPALPQEMYLLVDDRSYHAIIDVGGDERGALALGRISPMIEAEDDYDMYFVANYYRPLTRTAEDALVVLREIEDACHLKFSGIINNSNLGALTDLDVIKDSFEFANNLSKISNLPLVANCIEDKLYEKDKNLEKAFILHLQNRPVS